MYNFHWSYSSHDVFDNANVREHIIFDNNMVGLNILRVTSCEVAVTCPWLPETRKSGKSIEKIQPDTT